MPEKTSLSTKRVSASLEAFLSGLIDYAGLFPPASLDFDSAIRNYSRYRRSDDRWILGAFVCPASQVDALIAYEALLRADSVHPLALLGRPAVNIDEWEDGLRGLISAVEEIDQRLDGVVSTGALELKLPLGVASSTGRTEKAIRMLYSTFSADQYDFDFFVEVVPGGDGDAARNVARELLRHDRADGGRRAAMKIRTGGVTADAVPDAGVVASFLCSCRDEEIRFKATAGLHHPVRRYSSEVGTEMHGFLNVFAGAMIAAEHGLGPDKLRTILVDTSPDAFHFDEAGLTVGDLSVRPSRISRLRRDYAVSFGSCSFDEPQEDLRALGLLCV